MARDVSLSALMATTDQGVGGWYYEQMPSLADDSDEELAAVIDAALATLPTDMRRCVEMVVVARMSYRRAAVEMDWYLHNGLPAAKKVWRFVRNGLDELRDELEGQVHVPGLGTMDS